MSVQSLSIENVYFAVKGNSLHLYVYNPKTQKPESKSVNVLFGKGLIKCDVSLFNRQTQRFPKIAKEDNKQLENWKRMIENVLEDLQPTSAKQVFEALNVSASTTKSVTLLEYAISVRNSYNTSNWRRYNILINHLNEQAKTAKINERVFATMPIEDVNTDTFKDWVEYATAHNWGVRDCRNTFRHVVISYWENVRQKNFHFDYCPKVEEKTATLNTLTDKQLNQLINVSVEDVAMSGKRHNTTEYKTMLKDMCLLLYHSLSRHFDLISARVEDFHIDNGRMYWTYLAKKKRNTDENDFSDTPITKDAASIINKYIAGRKTGLLFPMLEDVKEDIADNWKSHDVPRNKVNMQLNEFLQSVGNLYHWKREGKKIKPTCTTLRHTAITNMCANSEVSNDVVAAIAHTSMKMLYKTYLNRKTYAAKATQDIAIFNL